MLAGRVQKGLERFVLGGAQLGLTYGATNRRVFDRVAATRVLELALDQGVALIDTARAYGQSEDVIGEVLERRGLDPAETVVTKVDPLADCDLFDERLVRRRVANSLEASRSQLRADQLGTVLLHREDHLDPSWPWILDVLLDAKSRKLLAKIGVSVSTPVGLERALAVRSIQHIQFPFNILDDRWPVESIPERVTIHCRSAFLQGVLLGPANVLPMAEPATSEETFRLIDDCVERLGYGSRIELLIDYVRWHRRFNGVIVGAVVGEELTEILSAWCTQSRLSDSNVNEMRAAFTGVPNNTLDPSLWTLEHIRGE